MCLAYMCREPSIKRSGCVLAVLDNYTAPKYIARLWCIYETYKRYQNEIADYISIQWIKNEIADTIGFESINAVVKSCLSDWLGTVGSTFENVLTSGGVSYVARALFQNFLDVNDDGSITFVEFRTAVVKYPWLTGKFQMNTDSLQEEFLNLLLTLVFWISCSLISI